MFWQNYLKYCNKVGLSPNAVAAKVGIKSTGTVTGWKKGAKPRQNVLLALADFFECSVNDLMSDEQTENPPPKGDGLSEKTKEAATLFERAEPWIQDQILSLLRAAESSREVQGDASTE